MAHSKLALVTAASMSLMVAACGSTSSAGGSSTSGGGSAAGGSSSAAGGSSSAATSAAQVVALPGQICGKGSGAKPGYTDPFAPASNAKKQLSGAGSTFVAPMMSVWTKDYSTQAAGTQVAYQSIGSGGGVQQISAETVDFGVSDTPLKPEEMAAAKGGAILHIPLILGGVVATYKVKGVKTGVKFSGEVLGKIYAGQITKWNDPQLTKLNAGLNLPDEPIAVVHRSDGSGTTAVWTDFLTKTSPSWTAKLGGAGTSTGKEVAWPVGIGGKGNEGVSGQVGQTEGAIGYVELSYALAQGLTYGLVQNKAGKFIQPCIETVAAATTNATFPADLRTSLTNETGANAYPITGTSYALVYVKQKDAATGAGVVNFLAWVLSKGQDDAAQINYAPLGKKLQNLAIGQLKKVTVNGAPVAK